MAANTLAPTGFQFDRMINASAGNFQATQYTILKSYATKIGYGDLVRTGASGDSPNQGYVISVTSNTGTVLGVFQGVLPYFDSTFQTTIFTQWWTGSGSPAADAGCLVADDPNIIFRAQGSGIAFAQTMRGNNIQILTATQATPNSAGISTTTLDMGNIATTNTYPIRIYGNSVGISGGPIDPANTNPWLEVTINPGQAERLAGTGI